MKRKDVNAKGRKYFLTRTVLKLVHDNNYFNKRYLFKFAGGPVSSGLKIKTRPNDIA